MIASSKLQGTLLVGLVVLGNAGCGVGKIVDDVIDLAKTVVDHPEADQAILETGGEFAGGAVWSLLHGGWSEMIEAEDGSRYFAQPSDSGLSTIWRVAPDGSGASPIIEERDLVALQVAHGSLSFATRSGGSLSVMTLPLQALKE